MIFLLIDCHFVRHDREQLVRQAAVSDLLVGNEFLTRPMHIVVPSSSRSVRIPSCYLYSTLHTLALALFVVDVAHVTPDSNIPPHSQIFFPRDRQYICYTVFVPVKPLSPRLSIGAIVSYEVAIFEVFNKS
jgi:hypothetical protein